MACIDLLSPSATLSPRHFYEIAAFLTNNLKLEYILSMESTHPYVYNRSTHEDHGFMSNLVIENLIFPSFVAILRRWKVESCIIGLNLRYLLTLAIKLKLKKKFR